MINGLYSLQFSSNKQIVGAGVVTINDGFISGGDSSFYYMGKLTEYNNEVKADINVRHYYGPNNSILGAMNNFNLNFKGKVVDDDVFDLYASVQEYPDLMVRAVGTRIASLPNAKN